MKAVELRKKSPEELNQFLAELLREQFNLRMQASLGQAGKLSDIRQARRNVARVKTVLREME